jgi:uncharacterized repeat protein (TIGR01451 family)
MSLEKIRFVRPLLVLVLLIVACDQPPTLTPTRTTTWTPPPSPTVVATLLPAKIVDREQATPGEVLQYSLVVMNDMVTGDDPGTAVTVMDKLPVDLEFVTGSLSSAATYDPVTRTVRWRGRVPRGGSIQVVFKAQMTSGAASSRSIINTMQVTDAYGRQAQASAQTHVRLPAPTASDVPMTPTPTVTRPPATPTLAPPPSPTEVQWPEYTAPYVKSLVVTPDDPPVYYLVVAEALYRSTDRGNTWRAETLQGIPSVAQVSFVGIDYRHPNTMYLATSEGLYRRDVPDEAWTLVNSIRLTCLAVDFMNSDVLWAGIGWDTAMRSVIVRSNDRGRTWSKADYGVEIGYRSAWVGAILINPNNPNVIWAHVRPGIRHGWPRGYVYRGGRDGTWERLPLGDFDFVGGPEPFGDMNRDVCFVSGLAYDPNLNALYAGCDVSYFNGDHRAYRLLRSGNGDSPDSAGVKWEVRAELGQAAAFGISSVRPLAVDAREPRSLYLFLDVTEESGSPRFRLLVSHDDGETWEEMDLKGLPGT